MKKLIYILIGIATFSIGFWVFQANFKTIDTNSVSICEVAAKPELYLSKQIKLKAFLAKGGYYDVVSDVVATDYKSDCASKVIIIISDELEKGEALSKIYIELEENRRESQKGMTDGWAVAETEFTGELIPTSKSGFSAKYYYVLTPIEAKQIAPVKFITPNEVSILNKNLSVK